VALAAVLLLAAWTCAALLAACGGSSGGVPLTTTSPSPTRVDVPHPTNGEPPAAAVDVVRRFWNAVGAGRLEEAQRTLVAPGSPVLQWNGEDIRSARFVSVMPNSVGRLAKGATILEFGITVWIEPSDSLGPWGDTGEHQLFEQVVLMSDGSWRLWGSGTGP
jgi:hypothetical protein